MLSVCLVIQTREPCMLLLGFIFDDLFFSSAFMQSHLCLYHSCVTFILKYYYWSFTIYHIICSSVVGNHFVSSRLCFFFIQCIFVELVLLFPYVVSRKQILKVLMSLFFHSCIMIPITVNGFASGFYLQEAYLEFAK